MSLVGLELNATTARAVRGAVGDYPLPWPLGPGEGDLPQILSSDNGAIDMGHAADKLRRKLPHVTCHSFLPLLGKEHTWQTGKRRLDSAAAFDLVCRHIAAYCGQAEGLTLSLPAYLTRAQADQARQIGAQGGLKVLGSLPAPLGAALAGYAEQHWQASVLVLDQDDHALSMSIVQAVDHQAHLGETRHFEHLGWRVWRERLINALSDCCVLQSRRDPRDSGRAEQGLYEQFDTVLSAAAQSRTVQLAIAADHWFQNLVVGAEEVAGFCQTLVRQTLGEVVRLLSSLPTEGVPSVVLLTSQVGRLPGLAQALLQLAEPAAAEPQRNGHSRPHSDEDFGETLLEDSGADRWQVVTLSPLAVARAAHGVGAHFQRGDLPRCHLESMAPLPLPWPDEAGPARLHFRGQDVVIRASALLIGTQADCQFPLDPAQFPDVAARHCEVFYDHRTFVLFNRSRAGTLVNNVPVTGSTVLRAGDRIRLGAHGPEMRFLGETRREASQP